MPLEDSTAEDLREATIAICLVGLVQSILCVLSLINGWTIWGLDGWFWLVAIVPEISLLVALRVHSKINGETKRDTRQKLSFALMSVMAALNVAALVVLIGSLLNSQEQDGGPLLLKAVVIWSTNVVAFGLLFWDRDAGGPVAHWGDTPVESHHFSFPQMQNPELAPEGWHPRLYDYIYISFTNSIAFSPTDVMPLTHRAKAGMMLESAISATTVLLAAARAVNILR